MKRRESKFKTRRKPAGKMSSRQHSIKTPQIKLTARREWLFRLITVIVLPLIFLGASEALLRVAGYGYSPGFFKKSRVDGRDYLIPNDTFSLRFFPESLARWPEPFIFPAVKPPNTIRIFVLGESAAMGDPQPAYAASRYLDVLLRHRFPGSRFEVINLGITAINSNVILPIARDCANAGGDFWIVYMGNNEMVGPFGAVTVFGAKALPWWIIRFNLALQETRLGQFLAATIRKVAGESKGLPVWGGMEMFLKNRIAPANPHKETIYRNFDANLRDIVRAGVSSGAKVILNTAAVNLKDCPPFASITDGNLSMTDGEQFDRAFGQAQAMLSQSNYQAAAEIFKRAIEFNPVSAEAHFRLAQCELALKSDAAQREFQLACDSDALPFRADSKINAAIRQVARQYSGNGLVLCDAEKAMARSAPTQIAGDEIFFEHVHFNFNGNYQLGKVWAEQIGQMLTASRHPPGETDWADHGTCDLALGLSIWNRQSVLESVLRRLGVPPLNMQSNNSERQEKLVAEGSLLSQRATQPGAVERTREEFASAIKGAPNDGLLYQSLASFLESVKDPQGAIAAYRRAKELLPDNYYASLRLGRLLGEQGQPEQGKTILEALTRWRPFVPDAWFELGNVQSLQGQYERALDCMERAIRFYPQEALYVCYRANMLVKLNRHSEAIEQYRKSIEMNPELWQAHFGLGGELVAAGQLHAAMQEYAAVVTIDPGQITARLNLGVLLFRDNRLDEAIECFQKALQIDPGNRTAREYLDSVLAPKARHH